MSYLESRTNQGYAFRDGEKNLDFYGYPYVVYDDKGTLVTVISFEENASKAVTAIYVWGMNVSCVPFAIHVFQLVIGEDIDLTSVLNGFERTNMYKKNGYIIEYSEPETDVFCFEVKGL